MKHKPYPYQSTLIDGILAELYAGKSDTIDLVLAAACGAGKTFMSITIMESILRVNPTLRVLVLTHGQVNLRSQFIEDIMNEKPKFTYTMVQSLSDLSKEVQVYVGLPQTLHRYTNLKKFDVVLIDEAHQFFWAKDGMVQKIIRQAKPHITLFMTGSPSKFIKEKYTLFSISLLELLEQGRVCSPIIELAKSRYTYTDKDYNADDELKEAVKLTPQQTNDTLDELLQHIEKTLKSVIRTNPILRNKINLLTSWKIAFRSMGKTMFVCKNQQQAFDVATYFKNKEMDVALSTSDEDKDSEELKRFRRDSKCLICVVVNRATLGFNYPELLNIVDLGGSKNVDILFQTFCRLVRKHPKGKDKLYFKVVPEHMSLYNWALMGFVLALAHKSVYDTYKGEYKRTRIPLPKDFIDKVKDSARGGGIKKTIRSVKINELPPLPRYEIFNSLWNKEGELLSSYAYATLKDVKEFFNVELEEQCKLVAEYIKLVGEAA